jgi:hypothetical protein
MKMLVAQPAVHAGGDSLIHFRCNNYPFGPSCWDRAGRRYTYYHRVYIGVPSAKFVGFKKYGPPFHFLVENGLVYRYHGTGQDWNWGPMIDGPCENMVQPIGPSGECLSPNCDPVGRPTSWTYSWTFPMSYLGFTPSTPRANKGYYYVYQGDAQDCDGRTVGPNFFNLYQGKYCFSATAP